MGKEFLYAKHLEACPFGLRCARSGGGPRLGVPPGTTGSRHPAPGPPGRSERGGCLIQAVKFSPAARGALAAGMPADAIFSDVEAALDALGALTGRSVQGDVTDRIFSRFCVGK